MMIATLDKIHETKNMMLARLDCTDEAESIVARTHPELCTPMAFERLRERLLRELREKQAILKAVVELCDALVREREAIARGECRYPESEHSS